MAEAESLSDKYKIFSNLKENLQLDSAAFNALITQFKDLEYIYENFKTKTKDDNF